MKEKTELLLGKNNIEKISNSKICVVGIGGVGGFVVENLIRTGIENICIIDFDIIEKSNINRQIVALNSTVGKTKVEVMQNRILDINPNCNVQIFNERLSKDNIEKFNFKQFDYVVDCIDIITNKIELIKYCKDNNIKIISALGAGNRVKIPDYEVIDIFKTKNDGLAKILRKKLKENNIDSLTCVCSKDIPDVKIQNPASIMWQPCVCGCVISAWIINEIIK